MEKHKHKSDLTIGKLPEIRTPCLMFEVLVLNTEVLAVVGMLQEN